MPTPGGRDPRGVRGRRRRVVTLSGGARADHPADLPALLREEQRVLPRATPALVPEQQGHAQVCFEKMSLHKLFL